jgi:hypothetical protein
MRKGVTGLQNIQLLKWCKEFGIEPSWNFLWGFPGEAAEEYERLARLVPLLTHLPAPTADARIRLDRFSPNFYDADRLGFTHVTPMPAYGHVYRLPDEAIGNLACYFKYQYKEPRDVEGYTRPLARELEKWRRAKNVSDLFSLNAGEHVVIVDLRPVSRAPFTLLTGLARRLYCACDAVKDLGQLVREEGARAYEPADPETIERTLAPLLDRGLLVREGSRYLALAIPLGEYRLPTTIVRQFSMLIRRVGVSDGNRWIVPMTGTDTGKRNRRSTRGAKVPNVTTAHFSIDLHGQLVIQAREQSQHGGRHHGEKDDKEEKEEESGEVSRSRQ